MYGSRSKEEGVYPDLAMNKVRISFVQPFVLYGNGGAGKSALLSKSALQSLKVNKSVLCLSDKLTYA